MEKTNEPKNYDHSMPYNGTWKKETGQLEFRMCNDYLFRAILQKDEETLKAVTASILRIEADKIEDIIITNPIMIGQIVSAKEITLDTHIMLSDGCEMDIEMQLEKHSGWEERSVLYLCRGYDGLSRGDEYTDIKVMWQVIFCDFCPFPEFPAFYSTYKLINTDNQYNVYSEKLKISTIDMTHTELADPDDDRYGLINFVKLVKMKI